MEIKDDTITLAVDLQGGMCDRLMLGSKGIINNAKASLDCWKFNAPDDEDIQALQYPDNVENALAFLIMDNYDIHVITKSEQINELLQDNEINIDLKDIPFKGNLFTIY